MAADRQKQLQQAERLLKQGKVPAALVELERLADGAPKDVLTLNRIGDLLAKQGRKDEAIRFYNKIALQFTQGGFLPKAVAIHKKVLRLNPSYVQSLVQLGELYFQQKLPGEARTYMLRAAEQYLHARNFSKAREVYESLVAAEPEDPRHRARLAEARAAEGDSGAAGEELLALAETLFAAGKPGEAEQAFRRAAELLPERDEPVVGLVRALGDQGKDAEALETLDRAEREHGGSALLLGERVLRYERAGRTRDAVELLKLPSAVDVEDDVFVEIFRHHRDRSGLDEAWRRYDAIFQRWDHGEHLPRLASLYERLVEVESEGHLPALERLLDVLRRGQDGERLGRALEQTIRTHRARGAEAQAEALLAELRRVAPGAAAVRPPDAPAPRAAADAPAIETQAVETGAAGVRAVEAGEPPIEAEAPAVPLSKADEEYVDGRLTQTEILEKYGLKDQAVQQVREVTLKFPGHVAGQRKLVQLLREGAEPAELQAALVALALALRAEGDGAAAREACVEAQAIGRLDERTAVMLAQLGLIERSGGARDGEPGAAAQADTAGSVGQVPAAGHAAGPSEVGSRRGHDGGAVLIDFDAMDDAEVDQADATEAAGTVSVSPEPPVEELRASDAEAAPASSARRVGEDVAEEIAALIDGGAIAEARRRLDALETLGWVEDRLDELRARLAEVEPATAEPAAGADAALDADDFGDDDDLSAITAALESELFADAAEPVAAAPESEQSLEDVFAAFKEHVDREVDSEDFRTHYDLGIAYKEMGLLDEAIAQFEHAVRSPEFGRDAYAMLALCHRDRDEIDAAVSCYRKAIGTPAADAETSNSLRYELAQALLDSGDRQGALEEFRHVLDADPSFRDVRLRVTELESVRS